MSLEKPRITPMLWFDTQAEEAARYYTTVFPNSRITLTTHYTAESSEASGQPAGGVMTVAFELDGQPFVALNGGPVFRFTEAVSFVINCVTQAEIDHYWGRLSEGGPVEAQQCGWLKDRFGLSWQVVPSNLGELLSGPDEEGSARAVAALMEMKKLDIAALERAAQGAPSD
jgi:predicted 3-demethylubiquinone-9 3-methyltransferase (glyoxalase superfamily)